MKPKTMLLMFVAIGCGLAASYMTSRLLADRNNVAPEEPKVKVLVAKIRIPAWVPIKDVDKYIEEKEVPESLAPKRALRDMSKLKGQRFLQALSEGEYILEEKLVNIEQAGLLAKLPPGMRAIALKVNAESLAGGFVLPGYRVDVVSTTRGSGVNTHDSASRIILQNMLVLAIDTIANRDNQTNSMLGSTVTLAATPEEAQRLSLAAALGELRLTLRTPDDNKIVRLPGAKAEDLSKPMRDSQAAKEEEAAQTASAPPVPSLPKEAVPSLTVAPEKPVEKGPPPVTHTLTIVSGDFVQRAVFTLDPIEKVWTNGSLDAGSDNVSAPKRSPTPSPLPPSADDKSRGGTNAPPAPAPSKGPVRGRIG